MLENRYFLAESLIWVRTQGDLQFAGKLQQITVQGLIYRISDYDLSDTGWILVIICTQENETGL